MKWEADAAAWVPGGGEGGLITLATGILLLL